ncbi:MAG TPA: transposase [Ktedonobacteraceae bacterium]|nr:transposase [Ktedonobacteraceae bacterium]
MQLVESHIIKPTDPRYRAIDAACFASKNLYNAALYEIRQAFIHDGMYLSYPTMDKRMQSHEAYKALPAKVAQQVLKLLDKNWQAFFKAIAAWREHPEQFLGRPKLPNYKDKAHGRNILIYTAQAVSKTALKKGVVKPSQLDIEVVSICPVVDQVRIVPRHGFYVVEVVYEQDSEQEPVNPDLYAGIDLGINNLATLTSNKSGFMPRLINGRPVKSINQFYNKRRADLQSKLANENAKRHTSHRLERFTNKRTRKIDHYLHIASRRIIDLLVSEGIGTLIIGYNQEWKQEVNIGKRNNQNFVNIPFARFIHMLTYKAELVGVQVRMTEESYTSKCSFLDGEPIGKHDVYAGKRVKRGLFRSASGKQYNADANGSYNIIRKVASDAFVQGSRGCVVHPSSLAV